MNNHPLLNRRHFVSAAGLALVSTGSLAHPGPTAAKSDDPTHGLKLGIASYSLRKFDLDQAIEMVKSLGVRYINLKDVHLKMDSTTEERKEAAKKIRDNGLVLMGGGVIYLKNDENQVRNAFNYVKDAGMPVMVSAPDLDALPLVEKMAKEYGVKVAIHNHGPGDNRYPSPRDAYRLVKDLDPCMGVCIDIGHTVRIGENEVEAIHAVQDRFYDMHIKDVTSRTRDGDSCEIGRGVIDIPGVLRALLEVNFTGHVGLEYEKDADHPLPGIRESIGYLRGVLAVI